MMADMTQYRMARQLRELREATKALLDEVVTARVEMQETQALMRPAEPPVRK